MPHHRETVETTFTILALDADSGDTKTIRFVAKGAMTSKETYGGGVTDMRMLGVAVYKIEISEDNNR